MTKIFEYTVSALCYSICWKRSYKDEILSAPYNEVARFVLSQHANMADFLRLPFLILTVLFDLLGFVYAGNFFHKSLPSVRLKQINSWKKSKFGFCRDFIKFFESLSAMPLYSRIIFDEH